MVTEIAQIEVLDDTGEHFLTTLHNSIHLLEETPGFISIKIRRQVENDNIFYLLIDWVTLDAHLINFRNSDNFILWRKALGKFFKSDPVVRHFEAIL